MRPHISGRIDIQRQRRRAKTGDDVEALMTGITTGNKTDNKPINLIRPGAATS